MKMERDLYEDGCKISLCSISWRLGLPFGLQGQLTRNLVSDRRKKIQTQIPTQ